MTSYTFEAERLAKMAHHFTYGDGADATVGAALAAEAQVYATLALAAAQQPVAPAPAAELTIYRASHDSIVMGRYPTEAAARAHCEEQERRQWVTGTDLTFDWIEDEEEGVAELVTVFPDEESPTGYTVTALTVASEYDPDGDE